MQHVVRLFSPQSGQVREVWIDAQDAELARRAAARDGEIVLSARAPRRSFGLAVRFRARLEPRFDVALLCVELSRLLRAGLTLSEALETQAARVQGHARRLYRFLHERLLEGRRLSEAMELAGSFSPMLVAAVGASERSGRVAEVLDEYARYQGSIQALRRKLINAGIYPALVVGFGLLVALFLLGYVVPRFSRLFADSSAPMTQATGVLLALGQTIDEHAGLVIVGLVTVATLVYAGSRDVRVSTAVVRTLMRVKPIAAWLTAFQLARITHAMSMLLSNGFTVPDAMRLAGRLATQEDLREQMRQATHEIETGHPVSVAWTSSKVADDYAVRILQAGERTGHLAACFQTLADVYRSEVETTLERVGRIVEPVLLMIVAVFIGLIVVLMYMPIFDLAAATA